MIPVFFQKILKAKLNLKKMPAIEPVNNNNNDNNNDEDNNNYYYDNIFYYY